MELCRLEYERPDGTWALGHAGVALLHPEKYPERLAKKGKRGRVTVLDERLQPTDTVYLGPEVEHPKEICRMCGGEGHQCEDLI